MSDDLIAGAKWTLENAAGMTLEDEEVRQLCDMADRIEELEKRNASLEAKLAKAVEALFEAIYLLDPDEEDILKGTGLYRIVTTFKELKGGKDGC